MLLVLFNEATENINYIIKAHKVILPDNNPCFSNVYPPLEEKRTFFTKQTDPKMPTWLH